MVFINKVREFLFPERSKDDLFYRIFNGLIVVAAIAIILLHAIPQWRVLSLEKFHGISDSYTGWAAAQILPAMYNYENRVRLLEWHEDFDKQTPFPEDTWSDPITWRNHYSLQRVTAPVQPAYSQRPFRLVLQSKYQNEQLLTVYHCKPSPKGGFAIELAHKEFTKD